MINQVVITDAFLEYEGQLILHPALKPYEESLLAKTQRWSLSEPYTPLSWYSSALNLKPSALLARCVDKLPAAAKQFWVASPYHAKLTRLDIRVMPEGLLDSSANDAENICALLNPLLVDEGMTLHRVGQGLVLSCNRTWDVLPSSFAEISGSVLPNHLPDGKDAGVWMRLLSEIQMTLHQSELSTASGLSYHGLWFWGATNKIADIDGSIFPYVATNSAYFNIVLRNFNKEQDATMVVTEAEQLPILLNSTGRLPKKWLLYGAGKSVELSSSVITACLGKIRTQKWKGV